MKFAEYIELLSDSPLTRAKFDALLKKRGIIYEVEEGDEYDQAVMSGHFRGKRSEFQYTKPKKEQSIDAYKGFAKDILAEVEAKADKDHKHDIEDINGLSADLQAISKSINDIDDKHTNKRISYEESQKKYQAEIQSLNDKIKRLYAKPEKDYSVSDIKGLQDELTSIQTNIQEASKTITKSIATKANKDHKHNIKDIEGIDKWSKTIKSDILDEIPTIDEVKQALDNVYIKSEVYNKEEVDNRLKKAVKPVYVTETMGMGGGGGRGGIRGSITGALSDQTDLRAALNGKVSVTGIYTDPSWLSSLAWSKITSKPTTLSGYGITDGWKTTGNTGTNPATNFIGTTDAQDFVIKTNGIERARVTSNGSVGIGTTTTAPGAKLDVYGKIVTTGTGNIYASGALGSGTGLSLSAPGILELRSVSGTSPYIQFTEDGKGYRGQIGFPNNSKDMVFQTDGSSFGLGSEKVRITSTGNVGIGTTTPTGKLHVNSVSASGNIIILNASAQTGRTYGLGIDSSSAFVIYDNVAATSRLAIADTGKIGIGTTTPTEKLSVVDGKIAVSGTGAGFKIGESVLQNGVNAYQLSTNAHFSTAGLFAVGTTPENGKSINVLEAGPTNVGLYIKGAPSKTSDFIQVQNSSSVTVANITAVGGAYFAGNIGIGTTTPTALCDLVGASSSRASIRVRSGTAPTTPNDGDIWYDGTDLKMRVGATTKTFTLV